VEIRETLQFLVSSDMPAKHKAVLLDLLTQALRVEEAAQTAARMAEPEAAPWHAHETKQLQSFLEGKVAKSWQHADELAIRVASQLHRSMQDVRIKAKELGLGEGIDYALARLRPPSPDR
jgi:gamma-glutamyl:cysteine ligase YbdK (ATP-grasp superfamily)